MRYWKPPVINGTPTVGIAVATYIKDEQDPRLKSLATLISSFRNQTYEKWKLIVVHDGPAVSPAVESKLIKLCDDYPNPQVDWMFTEKREQKFGHPHRENRIQSFVAKQIDWILLTNDDNYYMPVFLEAMLGAASAKKAQFVYCDMVHSHKMWAPLTTELRRGCIDLGCFMTHRDLANKVRFRDHSFSGDWTYVSDIMKRVTPKLITKVKSTLFVHN